MSQRRCEGMNGMWQGNNLFVIPTTATHQRLYLDIALWHHRAVSGYHPDTTGQYLDIILWHHSAVSGYHPGITGLYLDITLWHHRAVFGYCPVTSQCWIWIPSWSSVVSGYHPDHSTVAGYCPVTSQYCSWILSCDITVLYLDIFLWLWHQRVPFPLPRACTISQLQVLEWFKTYKQV